MKELDRLRKCLLRLGYNKDGILITTETYKKVIDMDDSDKLHITVTIEYKLNNRF